jgi:choline-sulfatase
MTKQPNIIVICSDQHHPLMSGYRGHSYVRTPNLDKLAQNGTHFTRAYCTSPVCTPSRMSFITGKYVHQIDNWMIGVPLSRKEMTWARRLDQAGIPSTMLGKMDFCGEYQDGGFSDNKIIYRRSAWKTIPLEKPSPERLDGYTRKDKRQHLVMAGSRTSDISETEKLGHLEEELGFYGHDRIVTDWALEYLRERGKQSKNKPWALYIGFLMPHWPFRVPEDYFNMYYPDNLELPFDFNIPNNNLHPAIRHFQKALDLGEVTEDMLRRTIAAYYGMITCMDAMVGEILQELEIQAFADNTYIIYTSDHGESLGEHGLFYKQCAYEGSVGVPLIMTGPDLPVGNVVDHPVSLVDMYPTIMDMVHLDTEEDRPGHSWLPLLKREEQKRPDYAFSEFHGNFFKHDWYMIVRENYKYIYYVNERPSLFDIVRDPHELNDLAQDHRYYNVLQDFEKLLRSIGNPEEIAFRAKRDYGLIGSDGTDYTMTLSVNDLK